MNEKENLEREIAEKFFSNKATREETEWVLEWFETPEGQQYLEKRVGEDYELMDDENIRFLVSELDSERVFSCVQSRIKPKTKRISSLEPLLKVAAAVLVIFLASLFVYTTYEPTTEEVVYHEPKRFQTTDDQQRAIRLKDGTRIRLNSNSEVLISEDFMSGSREVILTGEAYFEVKHNQESPFIIFANNSRIQVLGTAFNVKSRSGRDNVQVAVIDGKVSLASIERSLEKHSVILKKRQYGYLDVNQRTITVEEYAVENYLAWKNGRLIFEDLTLTKVCAQLTRIYGVQCSYADEDLKELNLTANFSNDSLEKTLSVISLSLEIDYEQTDGQVRWFNSQDQEQQDQELEVDNSLTG